MAAVLTPEQQLMLATSMSTNAGGRRGADGRRRGSMNFPGVRQSWLDDEKTQLANSLLEQGGSTAPVAAGGWAWLDGLSRLGAGAMGGKWAKDQREGYEDVAQQRATEFEERYKRAMVGAGGQPGAVDQTPQIQPSALLDNPIPGSSPGVTVQPPAPRQQGAVQSPTLSGNPTRPPVSGVISGGGVQPGATRGPRVLRPGDSARAQDISAQRPNASQLFRQGIVPIEGGTDRNGNFRRSPAGAWGPSQLMPGTAPEAMALAGFSRDDDRWKTDAAVNLAAGQAYYERQLQRFGGDPIKAAAAYNAGPGRVQQAVRKEAETGQHWTSFLPGETKNYVRNFAARTGAGAGGTVDTGGGEVSSQVSIPDVPAPMDMPTEPEIAQSRPSPRRLLAESLMGGGDAMFPLMQNYLDAGMEEEADLNKQREENVAQLQSLTHQSRMQAWQGQINAQYQSIIDEREAGIKHGYDMDLQRLQNEGQLANTMANNEAKGSTLRPLGVNSSNKLSSMNGQLTSLLSLTDSFDDSYFGKGASVLGDLQNKAYETLGIGDQKQVDWWKNYNMMDSIVKKELYGANFTQNEKADWDKSVITTATSPEQARMNLERRLQIVHAALMRQANSDAHVYNNEQIEDLIDLPGLSTRMSQRKPLYTPKAEGSGQGGGQQGKPASGGQAGGKLPYNATDKMVVGNKTYYLVNGDWMEETNEGSRASRPAGTPRKPTTAAPRRQFPYAPGVVPGITAPAPMPNNIPPYLRRRE